MIEVEAGGCRGVTAGQMKNKSGNNRKAKTPSHCAKVKL